MLFEVIHGVNGQFHSCADKVLGFLLESLNNVNLPRSLLFEILEEITTNIVVHIQPEYSEVFWNVCIDALQTVSLKWSAEREDIAAESIEFTLKLVGQAVEHRKGKLLESPVPLVKEISNLLSISELSETVLLALVQVGILVLLSNSARLPQEYASTLIRKLLQISNRNILLYFIDNISKYAGFEVLILPSFLNVCVKSELDVNCLKALTNLILKKAPPCGSGLKLYRWQKYTINFMPGEKNNVLQGILLDAIEGTFDDVDIYLCAVICFPHLVMSNSLINILASKLSKMITVLCTTLKEAHAEDYLKQKLFLLLHTLECAVHIMPTDFLKDHLNLLVDSLVPFVGDVLLLCSLKIMDVALTALRDEDDVTTVQLLTKLHASLETNLSSPYHEVSVICM